VDFGTACVCVCVCVLGVRVLHKHGFGAACVCVCVLGLRVLHKCGFWSCLCLCLCSGFEGLTQAWVLELLVFVFVFWV
jgi:hypothetical protein